MELNPLPPKEAVFYTQSFIYSNVLMTTVPPVTVKRNVFTYLA
jgi:hypothetical protein